MEKYRCLVDWLPFVSMMATNRKPGEQLPHNLFTRIVEAIVIASAASKDAAAASALDRARATEAEAASIRDDMSARLARVKAAVA